MMKTEILIEKEWKYFFNLIGNEILVQLNQKTKEAEFVLPASYAVFGNNKERYKIENGDLVVLEKQKVYARELANSFVDTAYPIVKNLDSYVQILQFLESANAKKSSSFLCPFSNSLASPKYGRYSSAEIKDMRLNSISANSSKDSSSNPDFVISSCLCFENSSLSLIGANISRRASKNNRIISPCEISILNNRLESITTCNYINPSLTNLSCIDLDTFSANSAASFSVNFDLETISLNLSKSLASFSPNNSSSLASSDQFIQFNRSILDLNSADILRATDTIYILPPFLISSNLSNKSALFSSLLFKTSGQLTSGIASIFFFKSSGTDIVKVGIFVPPQKDVNKQKYVNIYKDFGHDSKLGYKLIHITKAYYFVSKWSNVSNFTLVKSVVISLPTNNVDFGLMSLSQQDDTTDNSPSPILVRNDGNYIADLLNISANQSLWNSSLGGLGTSYMQIKAANVSTEPNSFNFSASLTDWANLTLYNQSIIKQLNYQDANDEAEIEVNLNVPADEPPGAKRTYITFYWESSPQ